MWTSSSKVFIHIAPQYVTPTTAPGSSTHPATPDVRANLACCTRLARDPAGARDQYAALLPVRKKILATEHPGTRANLAHWTAQANRLEQKQGVSINGQLSASTVRCRGKRITQT